MKILSELLDATVVDLLRTGKIGVIRTDTLYGIVCLADNQVAVERVFALKGRDGDKPPIVLISDARQLFDEPSSFEQTVVIDMWPGKVSLILSSPSAPAWIERGNHSVAYRLPEDTVLRQLIETTGPLIAPSANPQGLSPARTVQEAINYFGQQVDFYIDGGEVIDDTPSQLIEVGTNGQTKRLR